MVVEHELDGVQLDQLTDTGVAHGQVAEQTQCLGDDGLTCPPVLQVRDAASKE